MIWIPRRRLSSYTDVSAGQETKTEWQVGQGGIVLGAHHSHLKSEGERSYINMFLREAFKL